MSIRPVDLQVIIPKSAEANNTNQAHTRPEVQQQHFSERLHKQVEHDAKTVIQTNKSDKQGTVDKDGRNNNQEKPKKRKRFTDKDDKQDEKQTESGDLFDMKI